MAVFFTGGVIVAARHEKPAWIWVVFAIGILECIVVLLLSLLAYRPYKAERRAGYTTWPSLSEAKSATGRNAH
jgi:hypothetical protein